MNRQALLVLGVHRSGTSAMTGSLIQLGAQAPKTLMRTAEDNPLGYWESDVLRAFHERLLQAVGSEWHGWARLDQEWFASKAADEWAAELGTLLEKEFERAPVFAVKDPRICRFVPFWLTNLERARVTPSAVLMIRNPLEVAGSLRARNGFGTDRSLLIWLRHVLDAEFDTRTIRRSFVRFADLLDDWKAVVVRISADLGVTWPEQSRLRLGNLPSVVRPELRHQVVGPGSIPSDPLLADWLDRTWRAINLLVEPNPARVEEAFKALDDVRKEFDAATSLFGRVLKEEQTENLRLIPSLKCEGYQLREQLEVTQRRVDALLSSGSWRVTAPLRAIARLVMRRET